VAHASGCAARAHRGGVTVPAAGMVVRREAAARWLVGDEVDDTSNRGSRRGRRARGGGGRAYRAAARREVGVEVAHRCKSGSGRGPPVLGANKMASGR
jgi:hypothetical protein